MIRANLCIIIGSRLQVTRAESNKLTSIAHTCIAPPEPLSPSFFLPRTPGASLVETASDRLQWWWRIPFPPTTEKTWLREKFLDPLHTVLRRVLVVVVVAVVVVPMLWYWTAQAVLLGWWCVPLQGFTEKLLRGVRVYTFVKSVSKVCQKIHSQHSRPRITPACSVFENYHFGRVLQ